MAKTRKDKRFSRTYGCDPEFKGAFPGGPPLLGEEAARKILGDPEAYAEKIAEQLKKELEELEKAEASAESQSEDS